MRIFKSNKLLFVLTTLALILAFGVTTSSAKKKVTVELKGIGVFTEVKGMKTDDIKKHAIIFYEAKGAGTGSIGKFTFWSKGLLDSFRGYGPQVGFSKITDKDGHFYYTTFSGEATVTKSPKGERIVEWEGNWRITRGTGKWKHAKGKGKYKARYQGESSYTYFSQGVYIFE